MEACRQSRSLMRRKYFFEGAVLSIDLRRFSLADDFHLHFQHFISFALLSCRRAETLRGKLSARSFGSKSQCPGTQ
jgi:hypothetical protein